MRTRAYRPEVPVCLEARSLLSGVVGPSADPVVLTYRELAFVAQRMGQGFVAFGRYSDVSLLFEEIDDVIGLIPFERVDGLDASIRRIVNGMLHELSAHVPHAVRSAFHDVIAVTVADVQARVRAGDIILR